MSDAAGLDSFSPGNSDDGGDGAVRIPDVPWAQVAAPKARGVEPASGVHVSPASASLREAEAIPSPGPEGDANTVFIRSPRGQPLMELEEIGTDDDRIQLRGRLMGRFASRMHAAPLETGKLLRKVAGQPVLGYLPRWPAFWAADALPGRQGPQDRGRRADFLLFGALGSAVAVFLGTLGWLAAAAGRAGPLVVGAAVAFVPALIALGMPVTLTAGLVLLVFSFELAVVGQGVAVLSQAPLVGLPLIFVYVVVGEWVDRHFGRRELARAFNRAATVAATLSTVFVLFQATPYLENGVTPAIVVLASYAVLHGLRWWETGIPAYGFLFAVTAMIEALLLASGTFHQVGSGLAVPTAAAAGALTGLTMVSVRARPTRRGDRSRRRLRLGAWPLAMPALGVAASTLASSFAESGLGVAVAFLVGTPCFAAWLAAPGDSAWRGTAAALGFVFAAVSLALVIVEEAPHPTVAVAAAVAWAVVMALVAGAAWPDDDAVGPSWVQRARVRVWAARGAAVASAAYAVAATALALGRQHRGAFEFLLLSPALASVLMSVLSARRDRRRASDGQALVAMGSLLGLGAAVAIAAAATAAAFRAPDGTTAIWVVMAGIGVAVLGRAAGGPEALVHGTAIAAIVLGGSAASSLGAGRLSGLAPLFLGGLAVFTMRANAPRAAMHRVCTTAGYAAAFGTVVWSPALAGAAAALVVLTPQPWGRARRQGRLPRLHEWAAAVLIAVAVASSGWIVAVGLGLAFVAGSVAVIGAPYGDTRWSPAVGLLAAAAMGPALADGGVALAVAAVVAGVPLMVRVLDATLPESADDDSCHPPVGDGGVKWCERPRLVAGVAAIPAVVVAAGLWANQTVVSGTAVSVAALGLAAAASVAWGGWLGSIPVGGLVLLAPLAMLSLGAGTGGAVVTIVGATGIVASAAVVAERVSRRQPESMAERSLAWRRAGQSALLASLAPLQATTAALVFAGNDLGSETALAALVITLALSVARRAPHLASLAAVDAALIVLGESSRVQGGVSDAVALWFVGLAAVLASAYVVAQMVHSDGRQPARVLGWLGRNRAVLATVYAVGITAMISLAVAGAAIAVRDPLVRTGADDLLQRLANWRSSVL